MPVQLDLFGAPLRPPKKIREDEVPAPAATVVEESVQPAPAESYVAVIHPKDNKQGWHAITTSTPAEPPSDEGEATGVNEEAAIGEEAFTEDNPSEESKVGSTEQDIATEEPQEQETVTPTHEIITEKEPSVEEDEPEEEEFETEGIESFDEEEVDEPEEVIESETIVEGFIDGTANDFIDEEPETFIDEETAAEEIEADDAENFSEEEALDEPIADEPETEGVESFIEEEAEGETVAEEEGFVEKEAEEETIAEEPATEDVEDFGGQESETAEETALEETTEAANADEQEISQDEDGLVAEEMETEGVETFSEEEIKEADETGPFEEETTHEQTGSIALTEEQVEDGLLPEEELVAEEDNQPINGVVVAPQAATSVDASKQRGRKPIQDYDEDAGNLNVPPDEDLFKRQYYSMRETAAMFGVNQSLLRFWENEFKILQPKKNKKGDRYFRPVDVKNLVLIYHLLRVRKFTMEGAKEYLQSNKKAGDAFELGKRLEKLKSFLLELKASL